MSFATQPPPQAHGGRISRDNYDPSTGVAPVRKVIYPSSRRLHSLTALTLFSRSLPYRRRTIRRHLAFPQSNHTRNEMLYDDFEVSSGSSEKKSYAFFYPMLCCHPRSCSAFTLVVLFCMELVGCLLTIKEDLRYREKYS
jgi:hypothetical protein